MVATKAPPLNKTQGLNLIERFIHLFQACCNKRQPPSAAHFEKVLAQDCEITSNGRLIGRNLQEYFERVEDFQARYSHVEALDILAEPIVAENRLAILYDVTLTDLQGRKSIVHFMVMATIEDNLITHWKQITHEKSE